MNNETNAFALGAFIFIFFGAGIGIAISGADWRLETVARGLAQYCPTNGAWAWKGECK